MQKLIRIGNEPICTNCRFYAAANSEAGECRRFAPDHGDDTRLAIWPLLAAGDWCGEFDVRLVVSED
ncbi:hypothetical protein [uncultured Methylobacterium sp.]|uniref:hypothetical protein n=1 Tax=uncultured Methylobacterium sp. TaxID=157278 RepID=UPI0035C9752C